jgi:hypothetical protein
MMIQGVRCRGPHKRAKMPAMLRHPYCVEQKDFVHTDVDLCCLQCMRDGCFQSYVLSVASSCTALST